MSKQASAWLSEHSSSLTNGRPFESPDPEGCLATPQVTIRYPVVPLITEPQALRIEDVPPPNKRRASSLLAKARRNNGVVLFCRSGYERDVEQWDVWAADQAAGVFLRGVGVTEHKKRCFPRGQLRYYREQFTGRGVVNITCWRCGNWSRGTWDLEREPSTMRYIQETRLWQCVLCSAALKDRGVRVWPLRHRHPQQPRRQGAARRLLAVIKRAVLRRRCAARPVTPVPLVRLPRSASDSV